ncbi:MAG: Flp family type IVb pilin [Desulfobacterales bacterium]|nr:Flp family type IVb pilin [Desulfobacterales bacterium]MDD4073885.1 Flp family type IVb pilin [Desulfobacterales bacterium]MDD4391122.1 Flp family type IVb pilin [Desulfobacterales bacterium]
MKKLIQFINDEEGATAVEYALMVALIAVAIIAGAKALGGALGDKFNNVATTISGTASS